MTFTTALVSRAVRAAVAIVAVLIVAPATSRGQEPQRSVWLDVAVRQARPDDRLAVWVYFTDKGPQTSAVYSESPSLRTLARRARRGTPTDMTAFEDRPLATEYVQDVSRLVTRLRHESRWLNAVSVDASSAEIAAVSTLPYVSRLDVVRRYRQARDEAVEPLPASGRNDLGSRHATDEPLDYGTGIDQVRQLRVPELHARGLHGEGVIIAVFDSGFPNLAHEAFRSMSIVAQRDFVNGRDSVRESIHSHGTNTLSTLGGFAPGQLIGPAYAASFLLAVTEDVNSETPVEEDHWAAAAEWAELLGADVISSSLGYLEFDRPFTSYTDRDMDGQIAVTTRAAARAAERGMVVVNSAGNAGLDPGHNTLGAPADGLQVVTVGAVTRTGARAAFSSVGPTADGRLKPDVVAMGVNVKVARDVGNGYGVASGTSFSCPLTAGVVALVLQAHPDYTVDQVRSALRDTASQAGAPDNLLGWGVVDGVRAVEASVPTPVPAVRRVGGRRLPD